ncbi:acetyl-CoA carboxylase biotin carboxyl carrier protein subunit [Pseudochryseolinea flava]|uniref:Acetyl-CoA carboxylase biotin carboxyl carrier protein subunit n=1 Tax=Pseudochryseolinea flava TaxID=2059302 RepID=A0A364Y930_9BACT|nr:acetyl-CoA carboxylase biotin carboxyl carrier protein subunit [Pseudochryseolinea flava]RAW02985.1 acetyl-CoA carboxylase biotin carboxyl carrier protein subunit [Pseudochryseolinea flava]
MVKATVDNNEVFEISSNDEGFIINGKPLSWDLAKIGENHFHLIVDNKSFRAEVVKADHATKAFTIKLNGKNFQITLKDKFDLLLEQMGMNNSASNKVNNLRAPMPGLIIDLKVKEGDTVKQNDPLLILEAMKMENIIKSSGEGVVKRVKVKKGQSVEKGHVLIEF